MSNSSWIKLLKQAARSLARNRNHTARIALVGIGNEINGDDGAGVRIVHSLGQRLPGQPGRKFPNCGDEQFPNCGDEQSPNCGDEQSPNCGDWLLVEAGLAPENFTGTLRRFQPDLVVLIDAAEMGLLAGSVACLDWRDASGWSASTHSLPLNMLSAFLVSELDCQVMVLGIQPLQMGMDQPLSREVELTVEEVFTGLQSWMRVYN